MPNIFKTGKAQKHKCIYLLMKTIDEILVWWNINIHEKPMFIGAQKCEKLRVHWHLILYIWWQNLVHRPRLSERILSSYLTLTYQKPNIKTRFLHWHKESKIFCSNNLISEWPYPVTQLLHISSNLTHITSVNHKP